MKYLIIFLVLFFIVGCSGRVQTNPVPKQDDITLPGNYDMKLNDTVSGSAIRDYEVFIETIFAKPKDDSRSIWIDNADRSYK
ncbi:MAG: hypothetical protein LBJ88_04115 [Campylobacteraceae bacterium]|jgi:hypothetical protein|nr:hypothetical protein [Campylobacteraceae bacterium]